MKQYRIVRRAGEWHIVLEGQRCGILRCDERAPLVQTACRIASGLDATVSVYDPHNKLEARLTFHAGTLSVDGHYDGELSAVLVSPVAGAERAGGHSRPWKMARP